MCIRLHTDDDRSGIKINFQFYICILYEYELEYKHILAFRFGLIRDTQFKYPQQNEKLTNSQCSFGMKILKLKN